MIRALAVVIVLLTGPALAAPPVGADPDGPIAEWYQGLRDSDGHGCCSIADCRHLPTRIGKAGFEVYAGDEWIPVPPDKIIPNKENPTGEPVTCWLPGRGVMCFIEGAGT